MLADVLLISLVLRKDYRCVNISIKTVFTGILACYLLMYCKFIKKNRHKKVTGMRFHTIYIFVVLFYFRLRKLVVLLYKIKSSDGGVVLHICSGIKRNLVKCKEKLFLTSFAVVVLWRHQG